MSVLYRRRDFINIFKLFISLILICTVFTFSIYAKPVTEKVAKIFHKGIPTELDGKDIKVIGESVALSEKINMRGGLEEYHAPSIFFVIDNSFSMWLDNDRCRRDSMGNRFTVTERIIKHMADNPKEYEGVEVGVSIFGTGLYYEGDDDPNVLETLPDSLNPAANGRSGGYVPLLKLHKKYMTKNDSLKGSDILQNYLNTEIIGPNSNGYRYRFPTAPEDDANDGNTNIDLGFRAAVNAMKSSTSAKENHYIIFISDGAANSGLSDYQQGYVVDTDPLSPDTNLIPTTFTIFFQDETGGHPVSLDQMDLNIRNNGYSTSNAEHTQLWDFNNSTEDELFTFIRDNIIAVIMKKQVWRELRASGASGPASWNEQSEQFILPSLIPLTGIKTPINYTISFAFDTLKSRLTRSSVESFDVNFNTIIDHSLPALDPMFQAFYWERTLGFYDKNGNGIDEIGGDSVEFILKFSNDSISTRYEYTDVKVEVRSMNGKDVELFTLNEDGTQKYSLKINPKKVKKDAEQNNGILEFRAHDTLIATFRNSESTKLPLDTIDTSIPIIAEDLEMIQAIYFDNDANGRVDSIFVHIVGDFNFSDNDLSLLKEKIKLPEHRKFTIKKANSLENGLSFNVSQNSVINTAVTDKDKLILENDLGLSEYAKLISGTATVIDSVSPVIMSASLVDHMNPEKPDTLSVTFSEKVGKITTENPFLLFTAQDKKAYDATLKPQSQNGEIAVFTVLSLGNNMSKIGIGDFINIHKEGKVVDLVGNQQDNPENILRVIEIHRILELKEGIYFDNNADGRIDSVFAGIYGEYDFTKDDLTILGNQIKLPGHRELIVKRVNAGNNGFGLNVIQKISADINTAVTDKDILDIDSDIELANNGTFTKSSAAIIDSMAPVIMRAQLIDYLEPGENDTLTVTFSERVGNITTDKPFLLYSINENREYQAILSTLSQSGETAVFSVNSLSNNIIRISVGDSINIFADGKVFDFAGNRQDNPDNIDREIEIEVIHAPYNVDVRSTIKTFDDDFMHIQVLPRGLEYTTEFDSLSAVFNIYDAVGNIVEENLVMKLMRNNRKMYLQYDWDCRNHYGREVGRGSYLGLFHITAYFLEKGKIVAQTKYDNILRYLAVKD